MNAHAIAVDFDDTAAHLDDPGYKGLFDIFIRRRIPEDVVLRAYEETKKGKGFCIKNLLAELTARGHEFAHPSVIHKEFKAWLGRSLVAFPDALVAMQTWHEKHIPIVILTAGEASYQRAKIRAARIPYDKIVTVAHTNKKAPAIRRLLKQYGSPIAVFDDKASELDALREEGIVEADLVTVRVRRHHSRYYYQIPRYHHVEVEKLTDVLAF